MSDAPATPDPFEAAYEEGSRLFEQGRLNDAIEAFARAAAHKPADFRPWEMTACCHGSAGRWAECLAAFDHSRALGHECHMCCFNRATALVNLQRADEALLHGAVGQDLDQQERTGGQLHQLHRADHGRVLRRPHDQRGVVGEIGEEAGRVGETALDLASRVPEEVAHPADVGVGEYAGTAERVDNRGAIVAAPGASLRQDWGGRRTGGAA